MNCVEFVEKYLNLSLFPFQKEILNAWENGLEVRTARGLGRSSLAEGYGKYVAYKLANNNYEKDADIVFPYHYGVLNKLLDEHNVTKYKEQMSEKSFNSEYLCK